MSDFINSFNNLMRDEGGFTLHKVKGDTGGLTYAGISKKHHPDWKGWNFIEKDPNILHEAVTDFYKENYWDRIKADKYDDFEVKNIIFNFAVNTGCRTAIKLLQKVLRTNVDGLIGPITIKALNKMNPEIFCLKYTIEKIIRYTAICNKNPVQKKFLLGWINRSLRCLEEKK